MSYERMKQAEKDLEAVVAGWLAQAEASDQEEDRKYGAGRRGDELPDWVRDKEARLAKIRQAKAELEEEARSELAAQAAEKGDDDGPRRPPRGGKKKRPKKNGEPHDKVQLNFTDPDSKIMKGPQGYVQAYNCQIAVDRTAQIVVAHAASAKQNDVGELPTMVAQIQQNVGRNPAELSADSGYLSEDNLQILTARRIRGYVATGRQRHAESSPRARHKWQGRHTGAMQLRMARAGRRSRYRLRKSTVEPVSGQIKEARSFRRFLLRGLHKVPHEWAMVCTAHNLLKLIRRAA